MNKNLVLVLIFAVAAGMIMVSGCSTGSGGSGSLTSGISALSVSAAGPTGTAAFAAIKRSPETAIVSSDILAPHIKAYIRSTSGLTAVSKVYVSSDKNTIKFVQTVNSAEQYSIEIYPASYTLTGNIITDDAHVFFKSVVIDLVAATGQTTAYNVNITTADTAKAFAYDYWTKNVSQYGGYRDFAITADVTTLTSTIDAAMKSVATSEWLSGNFGWSSTIQSQASTAASQVPAANANYYTGTVTIPVNYGIPYNPSSQVATRQNTYDDDGLYLGFFLASGKPDLGNITYATAGSDAQTMIRYLGNSITLDDVTSVPDITKDGAPTGMNPYLHHALVANGTGMVAQLAVGQVFAVFINYHYGVIEINSVGLKEIQIKYKIARSASNTVMQM